MNNNKMIDDIIAMLDSSTEEGVGHMNIIVDNEGSINLEKTIEKSLSTDCAEGDLACKIPNLMEGVEK